MFLYCDTDTSNNPCAFVENSDGVTSSGADGWNYIKLTSDWRRIWVHFRTNTTFDVTKKITLTAIRQGTILLVRQNCSIRVRFLSRQHHRNWVSPLLIIK